MSARASWQPPQEQESAQAEGRYTMKFGKYKKRKLTVDEVHKEDPGYLEHIVSSMGTHISRYPGFKRSLIAAGLWLPIVQGIPEHRAKEARRVVDRKEQEQGIRHTQHPEFRALKEVHEAKAEAFLSVRGSGELVPHAEDEDPQLNALVERALRRRTRTRASSAEKLCRLCLHCGHPGHRSDACIVRSAA